MWPRSRLVRWGLLGLVLAGSLIRILPIQVPGYSLDEEITYFAVQGIQHHGMPLLPSGLLSERGLPFSYAAWGAGTLFGQSLTSYRLVSLLCGGLALVGIYFAARLIAHEAAALSACLLLAVFPLHIAVSGWARFYSLAAAAYLASVTLFLMSLHRLRLRGWFVASVAVSVLAHELCVTLVALPLLATAVRVDVGGTETKSWRRTFMWCLAITLLAQLALVGLHFLAPNGTLNPWLRQTVAGNVGLSGTAPLAPVLLSNPLTFACLTGLMASSAIALVRYAKAPPVFGTLCLLAALLFQLGLLATVVLVAVLLRPVLARVYLANGALAGFVSALFWTVHTSFVTSAAISVELLRSLVVYSLAYPLDAVRGFCSSLPLTATVIAVVALSTLAAPSPRDERVRMLLILTALGLVVLGVANVPLNSRYYIVSWPVVLIVVVYGLDLMLRAGSSSSTPRGLLLRRFAVAALIVGLTIEHRNYSRQNPVLETGRPDRLGMVQRVDSEGWSGALSTIPRDALVISNDELACVYHLGRVDYWLTTRDRDLAQYALVTDSGRYGLYAGARLISSLDDFRSVVRRTGGRLPVLVLFATGRFEYHLYRQIALDLARHDQRATIHELPNLFILILPAGQSP